MLILSKHIIITERGWIACLSETLWHVILCLRLYAMRIKLFPYKTSLLQSPWEKVKNNSYCFQPFHKHLDITPLIVTFLSPPSPHTTPKKKDLVPFVSFHKWRQLNYTKWSLLSTFLFSLANDDIVYEKSFHSTWFFKNKLNF